MGKLFWVLLLGVLVLQTALIAFSVWYGGWDFAVAYAIAPFAITGIISSIPGLIIVMASRR